MARELPGREPVGVIGQIIPWNFPLLMLAWKIAPALAMGNTVVLKPAEFTSLTALRFAELCQEIGPAPGRGEHHHRRRPRGRGARRASGRRQDRVHRLDRGRPDHPRRHRRQRQEAVARARRQVAVHRLSRRRPRQRGRGRGGRDLVQSGPGLLRRLADPGAGRQRRPRLVAKLKARMETLRVGDPLDKAVDMGAIIAPVQLEKIQGLVRRGQEEGAELWQPSWSCPQEGWFYPPTLFTEVAPSATIAQVEIFGPVVVLMTFRTPAEAVELANNTRYGLAASLWTENINLALDVAPQLKAGTVWINCTNVFDAASGFGGYRESGFGREGGAEGLQGVREVGGRTSGRAGERQAGKKASGRTGERSKQSARRDQRRAGSAASARPTALSPDRLPAIDRTPKLYIGGKQARPDSGYSLPVVGADGTSDRRGGPRQPQGHPERGRGGAEGARPGRAPPRTTGPRCCTTSPRTSPLAPTSSVAGWPRAAATRPRPPRRWRARSSGSTPTPRGPTSTTAGCTTRRSGTSRSRCPSRSACSASSAPRRRPLLGFVSTVMPAIAMGNTVVAVPSAHAPLAATDLYQVLDTSDVPGGVVNIVTGVPDELAAVLAAHDDVDGLWYFGTARGVDGGRAAVGGEHEADVGRLRARSGLDGRDRGEKARSFWRRRPRSRTSGCRTGSEVVRGSRWDASSEPLRTVCKAARPPH